jgi:cation-transporting ATPase E
VLDDVIELGPGDQIVVDGDLIEETNLEVDESLLTGEADPIDKDVGDKIMSGSFVVAGSGAYCATRVGREAYAAKLAEEASKFTLVKSELRSGINKILQFITYLLIPSGLLIIYTQLFTTDAGWRESVLRMVGALVPMVPEGLVLMTSIAFAVGVVRLGRRQCRRGVRRQDGHAHRKRHAGQRSQGAAHRRHRGRSRSAGRRRRAAERQHGRHR